MNPIIEHLIVAVSGGIILTAGYIAIEFIANRVKGDSGIDHKINKLMLEAIRSTDCKRFLIFRATNGVGIPKPNSPVYVSCLYEQFTYPFRSSINDYQDLFLGNDHVELLRDVDEHGQYVFDPKEHPYTFVARVYHEEGVAVSIIYKLHVNPYAFFYASAATDTVGMQNMLSDAQQLKLEIIALKIGVLFKKRFR